MPFLILVATPHAAFGEMLRMSLEDSGQYQVRLVQTGKEARAVSSHSVFQLAIIDAALQDEPFVPLCRELLHQQAGLRLVVIPPENNPNHPSLGGLLPHGYLSRPFYLPDLLDTVSRLLADRDQPLPAARPAGGDAAPASPPAGGLPPWLQEPLTLRGYLEKELTSTQALGALVGLSAARPGTGILRANAGKLDDPSADELAAVVFRYWNRNEKTDLMRFIRIARDKKDYLIYATHITGDLVLVMIYDSAAPLSLIRPQTKNMAQNLATVPPEGYHYPASSAAPFTEPEIIPPAEKPQPVIQLPGSMPGAAEPGAAPGGQAESAAAPAAGANETGAGAEPAASPPPDTWDEAAHRTAIAEPLTQPLDDGDILRRLRSGFAAGEDPLAGTSADGGAQNGAQNGAQGGGNGGSPRAEPPIARETPAPGSLAALPSFFDQPDDEDEVNSDIINLTALLGSIPPPDPNAEGKPGGGWLPERFAGQPIPTLTPQGLESYTSGGDTLTGNEAAPRNEPAPRSEPADRSDLAAQSDTETEDQPAAETIAQTGAHVPDHAEKLAADELMAADELLSGDGEAPPDRPERIPAAREVKTEPPTPMAGPTPILPQTPPSRTLLRRKPASEPAAETAVEESQVDEPEEPASAIQARSAGAPALKDADGYDIEEPPVDPLEDTRPRVVTSITSLGQLEAASPALSLLNYTCVLVPRLPQHYLTGELADKLALWVHQLCLAFGWRLEGIAIRPEYLQWSVQVAPAISPGNLVKIIRQRTSLHIFNAYDHLAQQNPSGDFWAPGYLIVSGAQPPSAQLLRDYILQTRKRQGINK